MRTSGARHVAASVHPHSSRRGSSWHRPGGRGVEAGQAEAHQAHKPVPIPGGTPVLGGDFHVFGPGFPGFDPPDAEPSTITDFNGFLGFAYISGEVTRTNTVTGEVLRSRS